LASAGYEDFRALGHEALRRRQADAAVAARDNRDFTVESAHDRLLKEMATAQMGACFSFHQYAPLGK
jgi:hypothetical protein